LSEENNKNGIALEVGDNLDINNPIIEWEIFHMH
jgi:hypothetical protein